MSTPLVRADALSLAGPEGPVFTDVTATVWPDVLTVVVGPAGSGRSTLLLALSGRMRDCRGRLLLGDAEQPAGSRDLRRWRRRSAVARLAGLVGPEDRLEVGQSVAERALLDGVRLAPAQRSFAAAEAVLGVTFDRGALVERLSGYDRTVLAAALALLAPADLVVLDDVDADLDTTDQARLLDALARVAASGPAVLVSTTERSVVPPGAVVVDLLPSSSPQKAS